MTEERKGLGDPIAEPDVQMASARKTLELIDQYLEGKSPRSMREIPWPLDRELLTQDLTTRVRSGTLTAEQGQRMLRLVDAYLLASFVPSALEALQAREHTGEDIGVSSALCAVVGLVGSAEETALAAGHYRQLVQHPSADDALSYLIVARDALGPAVTSVELAARMGRRAERLLASNDRDSQLEGRELMGERDNRLRDIDWADEARAALTRMDTPQPRLKALLNVYQERTDGFGEAYLVPWVVREIRKIADRSGRNVVIEALHREVEQSTAIRDDDDQAAFMNLRALRALVYFGVQITKADEAFYSKHAGDQVDPLSLDQLMPS